MVRDTAGAGRRVRGDCVAATDEQSRLRLLVDLASSAGAGIAVTYLTSSSKCTTLVYRCAARVGLRGVWNADAVGEGTEPGKGPVCSQETLRHAVDGRAVAYFGGGGALGGRPR